jgi:DNA gyrase subunit A
MEIGLTRKVDIDQEMQQSYLDYAMSVIVARALPDARDGLKPVQRRILYAMYDMGLRAESSYKKSARIVGEVLGKYHPHGDSAVYEAMARLAQPFSMRTMLVDGQGNFGSVDGDAPAAMRYTEARLAAPAFEILSQLEKNTVDFVNNFDGTLQEPLVLPAAIPNLLVNGASGIAVGMATNIPPHNLGEVVDALVLMLNKWEHLDDLSVGDLMKHILGPDFPTGGVILLDPETDGLSSAYATGRGRILVRASTHLEDMGRGRTGIIISELPYMANKSSLIERIAELVRAGTLEGIADLRDESDRQGMRIVIELSKTAEADRILASLYKHTLMQSTFGINLLALVNGEPHLLSLKQALHVYLDHRMEVVKRRTEYDLGKARARAHILEGLRIALGHLDEIIALIKAAPDVETARAKLMKRYKLSEIQATAILDMQLRRLAALERKKIELEYKEMMVTIKILEGLLSSPRKMRQAVSDELVAVKEKYGDRRRTQLVNLKKGGKVEHITVTSSMAPDQPAWVTVSADGIISRREGESAPRLSGREAPLQAVRTTAHQTLYLVTPAGHAVAVPVHAVPLEERGGVPVAQLSPVINQEGLAVLFAYPTSSIPKGRTAVNKLGYLLTVTRQGMLKKSALEELPGPTAQPFTLVRVNEGDRLDAIRFTAGSDHILLLSERGMAIRFSEEEVRPMGLVAGGVSGMKLAEGDAIAGVEILPEKGELMMVTRGGEAKRVDLTEFPVQGRYGQGVIAWKLGEGERLVGTLAGKKNATVTLFFVRLAAKLVRLDDAIQRGRAAGGKTFIELKPGDGIVAVMRPLEPQDITTG